MTQNKPPVQVEIDEISLPLCRRLAAFLDHDPNQLALGDDFPLTWTSVLFPPLARQSEIGPDGHPRKGEFLPDLGLPRRRFAGRDLELVRPMRIGEQLTRRSTVHEIAEKVGRSGPMAFVTVLHEAAGEGGVAYREYQRIVYLAAADSAPAPAKPKPQPVMPEPRWVKSARFGTVELFRYSALTYNAHRIHYDRDYAINAEGYPGLVVNGGLTTLSLLELAREALARPIGGYRMKALTPLFEGEEVQLCAAPTETGASLWAKGHDGRIAMTIEVDAFQG